MMFIRTALVGGIQPPTCCLTYRKLAKPQWRFRRFPRRYSRGAGPSGRGFAEGRVQDQGALESWSAIRELGQGIPPAGGGQV
jgi:hypothetical protein